MDKIKLGSHVSMKGREMMLGSVREALSYRADTFMLYTGAPQNTRRKGLDALCIPQAQALMREKGMESFAVHAPYIINLANSVKPDIFTLAVDFLALELERAQAMGSHVLILHPGSHVGAGVKAGTAQIIKGLNAVLTADTDCVIALETMAGKGSEIGRSFEELAAIYDGTIHPDKLRVCFDTCHVHDAGYDIVRDMEGVLEQFDRVLGRNQIALFHINDSKNPRGSAKDRHANIGEGQIGLPALHAIVHHPDFTAIPKILETPYIPDPQAPGKTMPPYEGEIALLRSPYAG